MSSELVYTSVPSGLKPGSKGFCTVAMTTGLSPAWIDRLESLSPYRAFYPLGDPKAGLNPINFSHWRVNVAGKTRSVLSRVAFDGADYSGRSNKLAHHIVLEPNEQAEGGPAWMLLQSGLMRTKWSGAPSQIPTGPKLPAGNEPPRPCATWAAALGDAGWAGALAKSFMTEPAKPAYLVYTPGTDVLKLFEESLSLLPPAKRWEVTFSTFFTDLPLNLSCAWRAVVAGTPAALEASRLGPRALLIDLTKPAAAALSDVYAQAARAGTGQVMVDTPIARTPVAPKKLVGATAVLDPEDTHVEMVLEEDWPAAVVPELKRRQKLKTSQSVGDGDEDLIGYGDLVKIPRNLRAQQQSEARRGIPAWAFVITIVGCLLLGAVGSVLTYNFSHRASLFAADNAYSKQLSDAKGAAAKSEASRIEAVAARDELAGDLKVAQDKLKEADERASEQIEKNHKLAKELQQQKDLASKPSVVAQNPVNLPKLPAKAVDWLPVKDIPATAQNALSPNFLSGSVKDNSVPLPPAPPDFALLTLTWPNGKFQEFSNTELASANTSLSFETRSDDNEKLLHIVANHSSLGGTIDRVEYPLVIHRKGTALAFEHTPENRPGSAIIAKQIDQILPQCMFVERNDQLAPVEEFCFRSANSELVLDGKYRDIGPLPPVVVLSASLTDPNWHAASDGSNLVTLMRNDEPTIKFTVRIEGSKSLTRKLICDWRTSRTPDATRSADLARVNSKVQSFNYKLTTNLDTSEEKLDQAIADQMKAIASDMRDLDSKMKTSSGDTRDKFQKQWDAAKQMLDDQKSGFSKEASSMTERLNKWNFPDFEVGICLPNNVPLQMVQVKCQLQ